MTLLEQAFQKAAQELNENEQNILAKFLLQQNLQSFLNTHIRLISDYNIEVQHAIKDSAQQKDLNHYDTVDEFFNQLK